MSEEPHSEIVQAILKEAPKPTDEFLELAPGVIFALKIDANGATYFALAPEVQAQLDRIEALLQPKEEKTEAPDFSWLREYLETDSIQITSDGHLHMIGTPEQLSEDNKEWIRRCYQREIITFKVVKPPGASA